MGEWIEWNGGNLPVRADACTEVRWRSGAMGIVRRPGDVRWMHHGYGGDIIAYRVEQNPAEPKPERQHITDAMKGDEIEAMFSMQSGQANNRVSSGQASPGWVGGVLQGVHQGEISRQGLETDQCEQEENPRSNRSVSPNLQNMPIGEAIGGVPQKFSYGAENVMQVMHSNGGEGSETKADGYAAPLYGARQSAAGNAALSANREIAKTTLRDMRREGAGSSRGLLEHMEREMALSGSSRANASTSCPSEIRAVANALGLVVVTAAEWNALREENERLRARSWHYTSTEAAIMVGKCLGRDISSEYCGDDMVSLLCSEVERLRKEVMRNAVAAKTGHDVVASDAQARAFVDDSTVVRASSLRPVHTSLLLMPDLTEHRLGGDKAR